MNYKIIMSLATQLLLSCSFSVVYAQKTAAIAPQTSITLTGNDFIKETMIFRNTKPGNESSVSTNYGSHQRITAVAWTNSGYTSHQRTLIYFNTSLIPRGSAIHSAILYLYSDPGVTGSNDANGNSQLSGSNAFYLEKLTSEWDELSVTWNNQPSTTTTGRLWVGPSSSTTENRQINITGFVQGWTNDPLSNYGLKMILENEVHYRSRNYASTEHANANLRPRLIINYTPATTIEALSCTSDEITEEALKSLPWYDNEAYLINYRDSLEMAWGNSTARVAGDIESPKWRVPVQFWVYQRGSGDPGGNIEFFPDEESFQRILDNANNATRANGIRFRFYIDGISLISNESALTINNSVEETYLATVNRNWNALNVHVVNAGLWGSYSTAHNSVFVNRESLTDARVASTFTHEVGHYFGLEHTHWGKGVLCMREPVTRERKVTACQAPWAKRCTVTGDALCDTDADPDMSEFGSYTHATCAWNANGKTDMYGDTYHPDSRNYMAYGNFGTVGAPCRTHFSHGQVTVMYHSANKNPVASLWKNLNNNNQFDRYEPDDAAIAARLISTDAFQTHTFHVNGRTDNVDWLRFDYNTASLSSFELIVRETTSNAVGTVDFFQRDANSGNPGTRMVGITSTTNGNLTIYRIPVSSLVLGRSYVIAINRGNTGYQEYDVQFREDKPLTIQGPSGVCSSNTTFTVANAPVGSSFTWTRTGGLNYVSGAGTANYTVRANTSGTTETITCAVTSMGVTENLTKTVQTGTSVISGHTVSGPTQVCEGETVSYLVSVPGGHRPEYNYLWSIPFYENVSQSNNTITARVQSSGYYGGTVTCRVTNTCGQSAAAPVLSVTNRCRLNFFQAYPNPAGDEFTLEAIVSEVSTEDHPREIHELKIMNKEGNHLDSYQFSTPEKSKTIGLKSLPKGEYILSVYDGLVWETIRLFKK